MHKLIAAALLGASLTASFAAARPPELSGVLNADQPYGSASLSWLFLTAYEIDLWTDAAAWSMNSSFALTITYRMSFTRDELIERTLKEMSKISPSLSPADKDRFAKALIKAWPNVKSGDRLTALYEPSKPVRFFHNGGPTTPVAESGFAEPFFGIWLSPQTSEPSVRARLLKLKR